MGRAVRIVSVGRDEQGGRAWKEAQPRPGLQATRLWFLFTDFNLANKSRSSIDHVAGARLHLVEIEFGGVE